MPYTGEQTWYQALASLLQHFDLVINATPVRDRIGFDILIQSPAKMLNLPTLVFFLFRMSGFSQSNGNHLLSFDHLIKGLAFYDSSFGTQPGCLRPSYFRLGSFPRYLKFAEMLSLPGSVIRDNKPLLCLLCCLSSSLFPLSKTFLKLSAMMRGTSFEVKSERLDNSFLSTENRTWDGLKSQSDYWVAQVYRYDVDKSP